MWFNVLKTEQLFVLYPWMIWVMISGLLGNDKIHSVTKIRGHPFMTSTNNDELFQPHPGCLQKWTIRQLFKNNRICKYMTNFKSLPSTIQITIFRFILWHNFFLYFPKFYYKLTHTEKLSKTYLKSVIILNLPTAHIKDCPKVRLDDLDN